jgi:hypothetical protein
MVGQILVAPSSDILIFLPRRTPLSGIPKKRWKDKEVKGWLSHRSSAGNIGEVKIKKNCGII